MVKRILIRTLLGTVVLLVFIVGTLSLMRSLGGSQLEKFKRELRDRGEKLQVSELAPGPAMSNALIARLTEAQSRMPAPPIGRDLIRLMETNKLGGAQVSWRRATNTWPEMHKLLNDNADNLDAIRKAITLKPKDLGHDYTNSNAFTGRELIEIRKTAQWLASAVAIELNRDRRAEALTNLLSLLDLVHCHEKEGSFVFQMVRGGVAGLAFAASWELLQANNWSEAQLALLQNSWERVSLAEPLEFSFQMERALMLTYFDMIRRGTNLTTVVGSSTSSLQDDLYEYLYTPVYKLGLSQNDELLYLKNHQKFLILFRRAKETSSGIEILKEHPVDYASFPWLAEVRFPMARIGRPSLLFAKRWVRFETERQAVLAAIGLERFRLRRGVYPERLEELVPEILKVVPVDFGDGRPLRYEREGTHFRVWSVMEDAVWPRAED